MIVSAATDRAFVELTGVLLRSLEVNGAMPDAQVIVFGDRLRQRDRTRLQACIARPIRFVDMEPERHRLSRLPSKAHWPIANYGRLIVPDLIADSGRLLFVDCDVIVNGSLTELATIDMRELPLAAVPVDDLDWRRKFNGRFDRRPEVETFNAGVMLFDLDEWRRRDLTNRIISWIDRNEHRIRGLCQDALNVVLDDEWLRIDRSYNEQGKRAKSLADFDRAKIIHFVGEVKPNFVGCTHLATPIFLEHRRHTPWGRARLRTAWDRRFTKWRGSVARAVARMIRRHGVSGSRARSSISAAGQP
jgi:lipopolysaccharide biosynthesis glycosyltransferase